jgi:D-alanine-D-alanine ligase
MRYLSSPGPLNIVILSGGESAERQVSLASGRAVRRALAAGGHRARSIDSANTDLAAVDWRGVDACFIALHGGAGEDGRVQAQLDSLRVAYTGSGPAASRLAMAKSAAKRAFLRSNVPTPASMTLNRGERCQSASVLGFPADLSFPVVVKPDGEGSSLGVGFAADETELGRRVAEAERFGERVLIERWIDGREFTVALLRRQPLPLIEIITPRGIFDYEAKYESLTTEYRFEHGLTAECEARLIAAAIAAAEALDTDGLVRVDLMLESHASGGDSPAVWVLEVNTSPGLTEHSLAPKAAEWAGLSLSELCDWMLRHALRREVTV